MKHAAFLILYVFCWTAVAVADNITDNSGKDTTTDTGSHYRSSPRLNYHSSTPQKPNPGSGSRNSFMNSVTGHGQKSQDTHMGMPNNDNRNY